MQSGWEGVDCVNYQELMRKRNVYQSGRGSIPELTLQSYEQAFEIEYTHNATAIEGNTLTLMETKVLLEEGITIGGKRLQEIYEVINHQKAYRYVKECIAKGQPLNEAVIVDMATRLMGHILEGGNYRNVDVYITGARHIPPSPSEMYQPLKDFYADLTWKHREVNPIELAAWTHAEFVKICPFLDGNGRTARLMMNYQLMANGFPAVSIANENRVEYFRALESYTVGGNLVPFAELVAELSEQQLDRYLGMLESSQGLQQRPIL